MPMFFTTITVPAGQPQSDPVIVPLNVRSGTLRYVAVYFPANTENTVNIRIADGDIRIGPSDGWLVGDDERLDWPERHVLQGPPYNLLIHGFGESSTSPYTIKVLAVVERGQ